MKNKYIYELAKPLRRYKKPISITWFGFLLMLTVGITFSVFNNRQAQAAALTWDGGGADNNWSTCANWSGDVCPTAGDTLTFNATSTKASTVDTGFGGVVTSLTIASGYTGTVSLARSLQTTGAFSQAAGGFSASNNILNVDGAFSLTAGTFTAPSTSLMVASTFTISGSPTFSQNGGTVTFDGATTATLSCNNTTFNLVTFAHTAGTKTVNSNCSLPLGSSPTITGNIGLVLNGNLSGNGTMTVGSSTNSSLTINSTGTLSGFTGLVVNGASGSTILAGATLNAGSYTTFDINTNFFLQSGAVFTAPSATATFAAGFTLNSGTTFNANGGTVTFDGSGGTLACNGTTFNSVTINKSGGNLFTVGSDCTLPLGNNPTIQSSTSGATLNGVLSGTGTLNTGTTGTFRINAGASLSGLSGLVTNAFTIDAASVNLGSYTSADFNGTFTLQNGATFTAPAGTATFASTFTLNSGTTFNANGGTIVFDEISTATTGTGSTLACNNTVFNQVQFTQAISTKTINANCILPLGNNPTAGVGGVIVLNGTLTGSGTMTTSRNLILNSGASLSGFNGLIASALTISGATTNLGSYALVDINSTFTLSSGTFTAPSGTMTVASIFTISGGTFNANGGTVTFDGNSGGAISCNNTTFNVVNISHTAGTRAVNANCSLPLGANPVMTAAVSLMGTLSGTGKLTENGSLTLNTGAVLSGFNGLSTGGTFTVNGATIDLTTYSPVTANGSFALSSGSFTAPSGTMTVAANFTITGGTFNANGGTVTFDGNSATLSCNNVIFNNVVIAKTVMITTSTVTINANCNLPLGTNPVVGIGAGTLRLLGTFSGNGTLSYNDTGILKLVTGYGINGFTGLVGPNLTIDNDVTADFGLYNTFDIDGALFIQDNSIATLPSANSTIGGDIILSSSAILNHNNGTVILDGNIQAITGDITFYNLSRTAPGTLTFPAGSTQTILGVLTLKGTSGNLLTLNSSVPGTQWNINPLGSRDISFVTVKDSNNLSPMPIIACNSVDDGNNTVWSFNSESCVAVADGSNAGGGGGGTSGITNTPVPQYFTQRRSDNAYSTIEEDTVALTQEQKDGESEADTGSSGNKTDTFQSDVISEDNAKTTEDINPSRKILFFVVASLLAVGLLIIIIAIYRKKRKKD